MNQLLMARGTVEHPGRFVAVRSVQYVVVLAAAAWLAQAYSSTVVIVFLGLVLLARMKFPTRYEWFELKHEAGKGAFIRGVFAGKTIERGGAVRVRDVEAGADRLTFQQDGAGGSFDVTTRSFKPETLQLIARVARDVVAGTPLDTEALATRPGVSASSRGEWQLAIVVETPSVVKLIGVPLALVLLPVVVWLMWLR